MNRIRDANLVQLLGRLLPGLSGATSASLVRSALRVLAVTALAQLLALGLQVLVARLLGPAEYGVYGFVLAGLGLGLILAKFGLDTTLIRLVAQFASAGETDRLRGLVRFARIAGLALGVVVGAGVAIWAIEAGGVSAPELRLAIVVGALLLPFAALSELTAAALRGLRHVALALTGDGLVRPLVAGATLLAIAATYPESLTGASALAAYLLGTAASLVLTTVVLHREVPHGQSTATRADLRRYLQTAMSLMLASGILVAMYALDTVMLGLMVGTTAAGFYSVASRVAIVVLFVMNGAQMVVAPMLAAYAGSGSTDELRRVVRVLNGLSMAAAVPAAVLLAVAAEPVMELFGPEFREAAPALRVLAMSQLANVVTGPTGMVLSMTGHEQTLVRLLLGGLVLNVVLNLLWIPAHGIVGAAAAALVSQAAWNITAVALIRSRLALDITPLDLFRPVRSRPA